MSKYLPLSLLILAYFAGCSFDPTPLPERPRDPWVFRSILDEQPRMVTLALSEAGYAAYDLENCALYKVWRGGIDLNGAAFNNVKTVQPISWGTSYWERDTTTTIWAVEAEGKIIDTQPTFKGYTIEQNSIQFSYELALDNENKILITESPEVTTKPDGKVVFTRTYSTKSIPDGTTVAHQELELPFNASETFTQEFDPVEVAPFSRQSVTGSRGRFWLERTGCDTCHEYDQKTIGPGYHQIAARYTDDAATIKTLVAKVQNGGSGSWGTVPMNPHPQLDRSDIARMVNYILSLAPNASDENMPKTPLGVPEKLESPGFGAPLKAVHPSYDLATIRPEWFKPRVGGLDFLPDGRLLVCTWDSVGAVYALSGVTSADSSQIEIQRIADGLAEPLGIKVVGEEIYVMQKNELTQLIDSNGDGVTNEYRSVCNTFGVTADFHEYSYGLEYKDEQFYGTLGLAMRLMKHERQHPDRGTVIRIGKDGKFKSIVNGLRQPNGIGTGVDGELFITENQGNWVPACKLIHVQEGDFHGCLLESGDRFDGLTMAQPAVWLPQDEIGNSPSQPVLIPSGPYQGQMLHGEVTHGGLKRVFLEKVKGSYQGCAFRFSQGLEAGINRMVWGPDGALYVGGVGMVGGWAWQENQFGLQRLEFNGESTFEILAIRATSDGFEIEFTQPLANDVGNNPDDYTLQQWWYKPTAAYGGPKLDLEDLVIQNVSVSNDRKKVRLTLPGIKPEHVIYFYLGEHFTNDSGQKLWTGESWYTLNSIPQN